MNTKILAAIIFITGLFSCKQNHDLEKGQKKNILLISVDDLRPELGVYGYNHIRSPNIDRIADDGLVFNRAYCQAAVCMPSRSSLLSGVRPENFETTGRLNVKSLEDNGIDVTTMPKLFKANGYQTVSIGKIYHHNVEDPLGWTRRYGANEKFGGIGYQSGYYDEYNRSILYRYLNAWSDKTLMDSVRPPAVEMVEKPDISTPDGRVRNLAISELERFSQNDSSFFLAVGFYRPHLPFTPPKKYWDMYSRAEINLADNPYSPENGIGYHDWNELRRYGDIPRNGSLSDEKAIELIHGYYASVSFIDAQIGMIIEKLKELNLYENTTIVLFGDHGWNLGEHTLWCKHSNYEVSTRTTLIIKPSYSIEKKWNNSLVGLIDIYPTLAEMCGLDLPNHAAGKSLVPIINGTINKVNERIFSLYRDSYSMRTDRYRFTKYFKPMQIRNNTNADSLGIYELYDHENDPNENINIAYEESKKAILEKLEREMNKYGFLPKND